LKPFKKIVRAIMFAPLVLVVLFEEWGWEPLARAFAALGRLPWLGQLERRIARLPPWAALLAFGVPVLTLIPIKLLALYFFGQGYMVLGLSLVVAAKLTGTALAARLFQLTEPALMQLKWFARLYSPWKSWKDRVLMQIRQSGPWRAAGRFKARLKAVGTRAWAAFKALR
jgi:hypothetical protein